MEHFHKISKHFSSSTIIWDESIDNYLISAETSSLHLLLAVSPTARLIMGVERSLSAVINAVIRLIIFWRSMREARCVGI